MHASVRVMEPGHTGGERPLQAQEFMQLVEAGAFADERVELLGGRLVAMSPQGSRHAWVSGRLLEELVRQLPRSYAVQGHSPLALDAASMPEPDVVVAPRPSTPQHLRDAMLVVEIADSSLLYDRTTKLARYAAARVPTYWLIDLKADRVHVFTEPLGDGELATYGHSAVLRVGDTLTVAALPDVRIAVADLLGA